MAMERLGLTEALTTDRDYEQAGLKALLLARRACEARGGATGLTGQSACPIQGPARRSSSSMARANSPGEERIRVLPFICETVHWMLSGSWEGRRIN